MTTNTHMLKVQELNGCMDFLHENGWGIQTLGIEMEIESYWLDRGYSKGTPAFKNRFDAIIRMLRVEAYTREKRRFLFQ